MPPGYHPRIRLARAKRPVPVVAIQHIGRIRRYIQVRSPSPSKSPHDVAHVGIGIADARRPGRVDKRTPTVVAPQLVGTRRCNTYRQIEIAVPVVVAPGTPVAIRRPRQRQARQQAPIVGIQRIDGTIVGHIQIQIPVSIKITPRCADAIQRAGRLDPSAHTAPSAQ